MSHNTLGVHSRKTNVVRQEIADVPIAAEEHFETVEENYDDEEDQRRPSQVRLETRSQSQIDVFIALDDLCLVEPDVSGADRNPGQNTGHGGQAGELQERSCQNSVSGQEKMVDLPRERHLIQIQTRTYMSVGSSEL